jgi:hypothetical protein
MLFSRRNLLNRFNLARLILKPRYDLFVFILAIVIIMLVLDIFLIVVVLLLVFILVLVHVILLHLVHLAVEVDHLVLILILLGPGSRELMELRNVRVLKGEGNAWCVSFIDGSLVQRLLSDTRHRHTMAILL